MGEPIVGRLHQALVFRNITYGRAERFAPAELLPFEDAVPQGTRGPLPPQQPSRLAIALGPQAPLTQREDCQVLSIHTPDLRGTRPVLVWFHGGAHVSGGGELPWYDGARLATEQDVVVVAVTFRLGVLGHYYEDGMEGPSPAMTDQMAAIEWVHRNIREFGGDPESIVLAGQSAGAMSIEVMLRWGLGPHVVGAILQSGNLRDPSVTYSPTTARAHARAFDSVLSGRNAHDLTVDELLHAQGVFAARMNGPTWGPVRPEIDRPVNMPILGGWTADDDLPFTALSHGFDRLTWDVRMLLDAQVQADTSVMYRDPTIGILREARAQGFKAWAYCFTWAVPDSPWGSPHCMELPFLLGGREAWASAPMLAGANWDDIEQLGRGVRRAWANFMRTSNPGSGWAEWSPDSMRVNHIPRPTAR
nr:carboxylesterase family protein [Phycicoccus sp. Soil803]